MRTLISAEFLRAAGARPGATNFCSLAEYERNSPAYYSNYHELQRYNKKKGNRDTTHRQDEYAKH